MSGLQRTTVNPAGVSPPLGRYSQLVRVRAGELLFLAGQVGVDSDGKLVGRDDVGLQVEQIYRNIGEVLRSAGASFGNVVQFTTYIVGRENVEPFLEARTGIVDELFPDYDYPPSTLLVIDGLAREEYLAEVTAIAALP
jgi:enamine deaminase RidA (YjgF/YER057c/UK114 family)